METPKARLKAIQRELLHGILDSIPPRGAAHGFCAGRSIVSCATPHTGQPVVLRIDLQNFFPSIRSAQVVGLFMTVGYSESVARLLAGLCTNRAAEFVWTSLELLNTALRYVIPSDKELFCRPHLPQGAPTSPALANLCAYRLDCRLHGLAEFAGAVYTRYADDLIFSGGDELSRSARRFLSLAGEIVRDEGFLLHTRKTRIMRRSVRQHALGLVVNHKPNIRRDDFDCLKATLHNCVRFGIASQNRHQHLNFSAHLTGRVAHVERVNPNRGQQLRALLALIVQS